MKPLACLCVVLFPGWALALQPALPAPPEPTKEEKLGELIQTIQDNLEADFSMSGVLVSGGKLVKNPTMPGEELQLRGKLVNPEQGDQVKQIATKALEADPYWRKGEGPLVVTIDQMKVSQGSTELAGQLYDLGLDAFRKNQFPEAENAFSQAMAEAPNEDIFRYWRVAMILAQGNEERAKQKLATLAPFYPLGSRTPKIAYAFERLQGPLRARLMQLESDMLLER